MKINLFDSKNLKLFHPGSVEFIVDIIFSIGYTSSNYGTTIAREETLQVIRELFRLDLVEICRWGNEFNVPKKELRSLNEFMQHIEGIWFVGANIPDFYGMPLFKYKDWYIESLINEGLKITSDWEEFVENHIPNFEKWIECHRPEDKNPSLFKEVEHFKKHPF